MSNYNILKNHIRSKLKKYNDYMEYENDISYYIKQYNPLYSCIIHNLTYRKFYYAGYNNNNYIIFISDSLFYYTVTEGLEIKILDEPEGSEIITIPEKNTELLGKEFLLSSFKHNSNDNFRIFLSDKKEIAKLKLKM